MEREADQFQWSSLTQKWCAALSTIFSRNSSINKLSQSIPTALCVCVSRDACASFCMGAWICVFSTFLCFGLCVCESVCIHVVSVSLSVWLMCLWDKGMPFHAYVCVFSALWLQYSEAVCVQVTARPCCNHNVWRLFFPHDNTCSDNRS